MDASCEKGQSEGLTAVGLFTVAARTGELNPADDPAPPTELHAGEACSRGRHNGLRQYQLYSLDLSSLRHRLDTHTHTHTHTPRCSAHIAPPPLTQGSFVFPSLVSFALVCCGVNRVQSLGDKFCLTKQTPGELFGNAFEVKGQGRAMCKQCYRAMLTKGAKATSVCGIKNVIEYRYFAKCCMKVQSSSVMITLAYYIITENKTSEAKMLKFTTWSPVLASCS